MKLSKLKSSDFKLKDFKLWLSKTKLRSQFAIRDGDKCPIARWIKAFVSLHNKSLKEFTVVPERVVFHLRRIDVKVDLPKWATRFIEAYDLSGDLGLALQATSAKSKR